MYRNEKGVEVYYVYMATLAPHRRNPLLKLFPPPVYLTMPSVGIDISDRTMKFVELSDERGRRVPTCFGDRPLEEGIIQGGKILDGDRLQKALAALKDEFSFSFVRASLPEQQAYVYQTKVPVVEDEEHLLQAIEFKLEENAPIPAQEALLGYEVLSTDTKGEYMSVTVTAYPKENADLYVAALERAGLTPLSLEIESQAIARSVIPEGNQDTHLIVDFGETRTGIAVVSCGLLAFTSTVEVRGSDLTEAIRKNRKVEAKEVAVIKNEEGIRAQAGGGELAEALRHVVASLASEIERHYTYWNTHIPEGGTCGEIKSILLCGGNANLAGLPEYLSSQLKVPAKRANVWVNAFSFEEEVPPISFRESLSYATTVGLALNQNR